MKQLLGLVATAALVSGVVAQSAREVSMRIGLPGGANPVLRVRNGEIGTIVLGDAGTFGLRPTVLDTAAGLVSVSVLEGAPPDSRVVAELDAALGGPSVDSGTTPPFTIAITRIFER
jgi:hypothetical protein